MKRTAIALLLGSLIVATQTVAAQSVFPEGADGEPRGLPALSTYADAHANDPVRIVGSPFPEGADGEPKGQPALSTYADGHANDPVRIVGSPFPEGAYGEYADLRAQDSSQFAETPQTDRASAE